MADKEKNTAVKAVVSERKTTGNLGNSAAGKESASVYSISELVKASNSVFCTSPDIVRAALQLAGKVGYTKEDAQRIVNVFKNKEVI